MPKPFRQLTPDQFVELVRAFPFKRQITSVHMHHTWRPTQRDYRGIETINGMYAFHTTPSPKGRGFSDIAQHITIAPDGTIWTGRNFNLPPASATGYNGNSKAGPFMFEIIGDFDRGREQLAGEQLRTVLRVIAEVQRRFGLPVESLAFHRQMSSKTCPGSGVDQTEILRQVRRVREEIERQTGNATRDLLFSSSAYSDGGDADSDAMASSMSDDPAVIELIQKAQTEEAQGLSEVVAEQEAEPICDEQEVIHDSGDRSNGISRGEGGVDLSPGTKQTLRRHVVNLTQGRFSTSGAFETSPADLQAIFTEHLPRFIAERGERPAHVLFFAHGGLVSERSGLALAQALLPWWMANGVYPIYFVWETDFFGTLGNLLRGRMQPQQTRGFIEDRITDPAAEATARLFGGPKIWGNMKYSAERAADPPSPGDASQVGGAYLTAELLKAFCDRHPSVQLHALGHSAGSIFHSHFLPTARQLGVPSLKTLSLLAPAIRVDAFKARLLPLMEGKPGKRWVERTSLYTMSKDYELDDFCGEVGRLKVYHKSLLYLIHHALEPERKTPILGLEVSLRSDPKLMQMFGLGGETNSPGEVIWSVTGAATAATERSTAEHHGDFDNDADTMEGVLLRILGATDADGLAQRFPKEARWDRPAGRSLTTVPGGDEMAEFSAALSGGVAPVLAVSSEPISEIVPSEPLSPPQPPASGDARAATRRALCIGIDAYTQFPLAGCVNDARHWAATLDEMGFGVQTLFDREATRARILHEIKVLIDSGRAGDVLVIQYAGHGTYFPDRSGDEPDGKDEALVPVDMDKNLFILDDELFALYSRVADGVNLTCFYDCCHSGTMSRAAATNLLAMSADPSGGGVRLRFIDPTVGMVERYQTLRQQGALPRVADNVQRSKAVSFGACTDRQVAMERDGHGVFTTLVTPMLKAAWRQGTSHDVFQQQIAAQFQSKEPGQTPTLDVASHNRSRSLLQPIG